MTTVSVSHQQQADYRFEIRFGEGISSLIADEPSPLGKGAARLLRSCCVPRWATV